MISASWPFSPALKGPREARRILTSIPMDNAAKRCEARRMTPLPVPTSRVRPRGWGRHTLSARPRQGQTLDIETVRESRPSICKGAKGRTDSALSSRRLRTAGGYATRGQRELHLASEGGYRIIEPSSRRRSVAPSSRRWRAAKLPLHRRLAPSSLSPRPRNLVDLHALAPKWRSRPPGRTAWKEGGRASRSGLDRLSGQHPDRLEA